MRSKLYDVDLKNCGPNFINCIKAVRGIREDFGLIQAKDYCDAVRMNNGPFSNTLSVEPLLRSVEYKVARRARALLKKIGAEASIRLVSLPSEHRMAKTLRRLF